MMTGRIREVHTEKSMNQRSHAPMIVLRILPVLFAVWWIAALAVSVAASPQNEREEPEQHASEAASTEVAADPSVTATAGMKVYIDRETGEITSTPPREQTKALSAPLAIALSRSTEGLVVFDLPNGGKGVYLKGRFQHALTVRVKPNGSLETVCMNHLHKAEDLFHGEPVGGDAEPRDR
jgi:hypothetical protein